MKMRDPLDDLPGGAPGTQTGTPAPEPKRKRDWLMIGAGVVVVVALVSVIHALIG